MGKYSIVHEFGNLIHEGDMSSVMHVLLAFKALGGVNFNRLYVVDPSGVEHQAAVWAGQL